MNTIMKFKKGQKCKVLKHIHKLAPSSNVKDYVTNYNPRQKTVFNAGDIVEIGNLVHEGAGGVEYFVSKNNFRSSHWVNELFLETIVA